MCGITGFEAGEQSGEVAGFFYGRAAGTFEVGAAFIGDDVCQSGFSQSRGAAEQDVIKSFVAFFGGADEKFELFLDPVLTGELVKTGRTEGGFPDRIAPVECRSDKTFSHYVKIFCNKTCFSCVSVIL